MRSSWSATGGCSAGAVRVPLADIIKASKDASTGHSNLTLNVPESHGFGMSPRSVSGFSPRDTLRQLLGMVVSRPYSGLGNTVIRGAYFSIRAREISMKHP